MTRDELRETVRNIIGEACAISFSNALRGTESDEGNRIPVDVNAHTDAIMALIPEGGLPVEPSDEVVEGG